MTLYAPDEPRALAAAKAAFARIAELDAVLSDYREDSELMRLSAAAGQSPLPVSEDLFAVLARAGEISALTDGAFDITVGPVVQLWRAARRSGVLPAEASLADALALVGADLIQLDAQNRSARLLEAGMRLDAGGIGKGYAAQEAVETLREQGCPSALVALAGDVVAGDPPPGEDGWRIAVAGMGEMILLLRNGAVSTSGDEVQFVEIDGRRYSHIVDPRTGLGVTSRTRATVLAPDGATADALASALTVLGVDRGLEAAARFEDATAFLQEQAASGERTAAHIDPAPFWRVAGNDTAAPEGFEPLFNGRDLGGWRERASDPGSVAAMPADELATTLADANAKAAAHWHVVGGTLVFDGRGDNLCTAEAYGDFELLLDWMIPPGGDSGVYLRGVPQVQIWDHPDGSGGLYNNERGGSRPLVRADRPPGSWNTFRVRMRGDRVHVWLNDQLVVDGVPLENFWDRGGPLPKSGAIELQSHGGPLFFRNIHVRRLGVE